MRFLILVSFANRIYPVKQSRLAINEIAASLRSSQSRVQLPLNTFADNMTDSNMSFLDALGIV